MDEADGLILTTEYETMSSIERFWFVNPQLRLRTSTVKRFGGFSTASFCSEAQMSPENSDRQAADESSTASVSSPESASVSQPSTAVSPLGW
jgi:hypothetical protein